MKHTPGPWFTEVGTARVLSDDARATIICEVTGAPNNPATIADARLIAAAPDLIAAALECVEMENEPRFLYGAIKSLKAAISKATGEDV